MDACRYLKVMNNDMAQFILKITIEQSNKQVRFQLLL